MLTYPLNKESGRSLYEQLYEGIRRDILSGTLPAHQRLPSKRALAQHLEVSIITVQNAYEQLAAEGYIYSQEKRGYYVSPVERPLQAAARQPAPLPPEPEQKTYFLDLVTNSIDRAYFPFTVWARLMRETLLERDKALLQAAPYNGAEELRRAISDYLRQFRGMNVDSGQIIVGAGTEFLYSLLIQLLGREKCYAVEDPGYSKIAEIYRSHQVNLRQVGLDEKGLSTRLLRRQEADIVHLSPSHHYPTGIVMPIGRRQELLRWAEEQEGRWILEDDYDSEFRFVGRPIPTLFSIDEAQRVIYLNTFSKTIAPSIRISYMILPPRLMEVYREKLGFYACTVSGFEQYTLAKFMAQGRYEQHLSRMKARYRQKRDAVIAMLRSSPLADRVEIMEQDAGLHFLVRLDTRLPDAAPGGGAGGASGAAVGLLQRPVVGAPAYRGGKLFRHRPGASAGGTAPSGASLGGITMYDELTRGDVQKMQEEIDYRTQVLRPKLIEDVQTARAFGDLSENFEYKCAKQEKNRNDSRIRYLQRMIKTARIIDDRSGQDTAGLYDTVEIFMENTGKSRRIQLVTTLRQDALKGLISKESPVGKAVLGRRAGDRVQVDMGGGRSYWITIRSIEKGTDDGSIPIGSF